VSVLIVSEGVDIPRLRVGVYATAARTELFFRQVIGRFVRRTPAPKAQMSYLLLPADIRLKALAAQIEEERNHALEQKPEREEQQDRERSAGEQAFHALSSSAYADDAITSSIHGDDLQLFFDPDPQKPAPKAPAPPPAPPAHLREEPAYARRERLREERNKLVADICRRTGEPHRQIHARMNRATGSKSVGAATVDQLEKANALLTKELRTRL
jgi:superfamily II DNA or RNA helicase